MFSQILAKSGSKIRLESSIKNLLPPNDLKNLGIVDFIFFCISWKWTIYSATTFLEKCRKVVLQTQIFFSGQPLFLKQISCGFMV